METPKRFNLEEAREEASKVRYLAGERPAAERYQIASEIMDMRKEKLELRKFEKDIATLQYLDDKKEIVEFLGYNLIANEDLQKGTTERGSLQRDDVNKVLEQAFRLMDRNTRDEIALLSERSDRSWRVRNPSPEDTPEKMQERIKRLQAQLESYRDFRSRGLESMKELSNEVFVATVQTPEDLDDALALLLEEIAERLNRAKMGISKLQEPDKLEKWKVLEQHESSLKAERKAYEEQTKKEKDRILAEEKERERLAQERRQEQKGKRREQRSRQFNEFWDKQELHFQEERKNHNWENIEGEQFAHAIADRDAWCSFEHCERRKQQGADGRKIRVGEEVFYQLVQTPGYMVWNQEPVLHKDCVTDYVQWKRAIHQAVEKKEDVYDLGLRNLPLLSPEIEVVKLPKQIVEWLEQNPNATIMVPGYGDAPPHFYKGKDRIIPELKKYFYDDELQRKIPGKWWPSVNIFVGRIVKINAIEIVPEEEQDTILPDALKGWGRWKKKSS